MRMRYLSERTKSMIEMKRALEVYLTDLKKCFVLTPLGEKSVSDELIFLDEEGYQENTVMDLDELADSLSKIFRGDWLTAGDPWGRGLLELIHSVEWERDEVQVLLVKETPRGIDIFWDYDTDRWEKGSPSSSYSGGYAIYWAPPETEPDITFD